MHLEEKYTSYSKRNFTSNENAACANIVSNNIRKHYGIYYLAIGNYICKLFRDKEPIKKIMFSYFNRAY